MSCAVRLRRLTLDQLDIDDERSFRHISLYDQLKHALRRDAVPFLVPEPGSPPSSWDRVLFLNLTFWSAAEPTELLVEPRIPADVVMHAAWHHLARRALAPEPACPPSAEALFLGEAIASAFDLYLVGRLLGHAPESEFLQTQVPAMAEVAQGAGMTEEAFERMLETVGNDPDRAFEDLRALLFDAACALVRCTDVEAAAHAFEVLEGRSFAPILHHYELSNWILYARAYARPAAGEPQDSRAAAVDATLRAEAAAGRSALDWLEKSWLVGGGNA
jgi:hypothetical protein